jgi:hypothetical protein
MMPLMFLASSPQGIPINLLGDRWLRSASRQCPFIVLVSVEVIREPREVFVPTGAAGPARPL